MKIDIVVGWADREARQWSAEDSRQRRTKNLSRRWLRRVPPLVEICPAVG